MLHVLYLVHDLVDTAVRRRVMMLNAGGAKVTLAGFHRGRSAAAEFGDIAPIDLGVTRDGRFAQRLAAVARAALTLGAKLRGVAKPDLIIGRNLEMLALAHRAKALFSADTPIGL
jgi:succinoglycan biosynthesis protein ExoL